MESALSEVKTVFGAEVSSLGIFERIWPFILSLCDRYPPIKICVRQFKEAKVVCIQTFIWLHYKIDEPHNAL